MAYNNNYLYPATYQPMYPQAPVYPQSYASGLQQQSVAPSANTQTSNRWDWVQGQNGAKAYLVAPNTTVLLLDSEGQKFYLKSADASGMPLPLRTFEYTETTQDAASGASSKSESIDAIYATKADLNELSRRLDELTARPSSRKKEASDE